MTFTIIICLLILANAIPIFIFSYRKRKYGIYPGIIFAILFGAYLVYYVLPYKMAVDTKISVYESDPSQSKKKIASAILANSNSLANQSSELEEKLHTHMDILDILIKICYTQSIICILLSLWGLISISGRNRFYLQLIGIHGILLGLCLFIELTKHFTKEF